MQSEKIDLLASALCAFQGELQDVEKNAENPFFKSGYADLSAVWNTVRPLLLKHGLSVMQRGLVVQDQGTFLETVLMHKSGQWAAGSIPLLTKDGTMQSMGSAISYARRYGLSAILGVTQADDDGELASKPAGKILSAPPAKPFAMPGEYVIPFGRSKGQKMKDISLMDFEGLKAWLIKQGNISAQGQEIIANGDSFFGAPMDDLPPGM